ncbi:MAG: MG2 domain-containing protein, partial [Massilia sp.]
MHHRTLLGSLLLALTHPATAAPALVDFGPAGFTREVRQVRMRFSEDMVALGDSAAPGAASVSCNQSRLKAAGHWIDPRNWVAEFDAPLPDGVACEVAPAALTSVKGVSLPAMAAWSFNTGGPRAELIDLRIDVTREEPVGVFKPSVAVDADSLRHLRCQVDAVDTPVTILDGASRKVALAKKRPAQVGSPDTDRWIVAQCGARPWPNGARINWIWGKAISANGVASVLDASYHQRVRPALRYDVKCSQLPERGGCDPRGPFTVVFSEPLYNAGARSMKLRGGEGREYAVESNCGYTTSCTEFSVKTVLREGESITPVFSHAIHDIEGRLMADDSSTRRAFPIARLKPYVGIVQGNVALPWTPGTQARIAVAARNTEPEISVRSLRFGAAPRDISALIALHRMAAAGFEDVLTGALPLKPYAASDAVITRLGQTRSAMTEQKLRPSGPGMEFIGLPLAGFGTWLVEADSALHRAVLANLPVAASARNRPGDRGTDRLALVQLTNLRITSRLSPDHPSLVWVSAIDSGKPVGGAEVELWSCDGKRLAQAVGDAEGRVLFAHLPAMPACEAAGGAPIGEFYIVARSGDDICVLHNSAFDKHSAYRSAMAGHTILDRVLFKAGETVSMQSLARMPVPAGFAIPRPFKGKLKIYVGGDELVHEQELAFDRDGSATSEWKIPKTARLGYYSFTLFDADDKTISQGGFQVEEYRLPSFDASLTAATAWQGDRQYLTLSGGLRFLAGGAAAGQRVTLRGRYDGYSFYGDSGHTFQDIERGELNAPPFAAHTLTLDAAGKAAITLPAPLAGQYMALNAEMEFVDPNGETQTERVHLPIWPQRHRVGVSVR